MPPTTRRHNKRVEVMVKLQVLELDAAEMAETAGLAENDVFANPELLPRVFSFLPPCYLVCGNVSRLWCSRYLATRRQRFQEASASERARYIPRTPTGYKTGAPDGQYQYVRTYCAYVYDTALEVAASSKALALWLSDAGLPWGKAFLEHVVKSPAGIAIMQCGQAERPRKMHPAVAQRVYEAAARWGVVNVLRWALEGGLSRPKRLDVQVDATRAAAEEGHLEPLQLLRGAGFLWDARLGCAAARGGHLHVLEWATGNGYVLEPSMRLCEKAAKEGHRDVVLWAHQKGQAWDKTCTVAVRAGHWQLAIAAHRLGCPWDASTCAAAIERWDLSVVLHLRREGCPWDPQACSKAARAGRLEFLKGLIEAGFEVHRETIMWCLVVGKNLAAMQWGREMGFPWNGLEWREVSRNFDERVARWLVEKRCPWVAKGLCANMPMREWIHQNEYPCKCLR